MAPIIKWAGGKEKELPYILQNATEFFASIHKELELIYLEYRCGKYCEGDIKKEIGSLCDKFHSKILAILPQTLGKNKKKLIAEIISSLYSKMRRMKRIEASKNILPDKDIFDNLETAVKGAIYTHLRMLYNDSSLSPIAHCCLFFFIRNYAYSGMFRYNQKGNFNVPYGGIAYNKKSLLPKIDYYRSEDLLQHFSKTTITGLDFESFFNLHTPKVDDFIFLDPPYDSEFSTYAQNEFSHKDHERLANYLIRHVRCKWLMIIKSTPFIMSLYSNIDNVNISSFEKEYQVSFMNRNQKKATHLIIKNY